MFSVPSRRLPVEAGRAMRPLTMDEVSIDPDSYWGRWQHVNGTRMIDHCAEWMERMGWVGNLRAAAAGTLPDARRGREFTDSDVYKLIEAMSWEQGRKPTVEREKAIVDLIAIVAAAQDVDGYINTNFGRPGQVGRYQDMEWGSELYNYGHLLQAAVARLRTRGPDELLEVATKVADHICDVFGEGGLETICGHPEVELGLIEFARATGNDGYRRQAELFLDRRGHHVLKDIEYGREYFQDDMPIRDAYVFRGHAVRATYLAAGAVDRAIDRDDVDLIETIERQLERTLASRTYLTGGMGSHHQDEAFGADFELPADRAYSETCAAVGAFMLGWRLLLATGKARYGDLMERTLFNVIATSPSEDGTSFFYANPLEQRTLGAPVPSDEASLRVGPGVRAPWFDVSCCPTNVARTFASLNAYIATVTSDGLSIVLYASGTVRTILPDGREVHVRMSTLYPEEGSIGLSVAGGTAPWTLRLRIPEWSNSATIRRGDGSLVDVAPGWAVIEGVGAHDEEITLDLDTAPRFTFGDPRIDCARGAVAVEQGPLVYCLESPDLADGRSVDEVLIDTSITPWFEGGRVYVTAQPDHNAARDWPYSSEELLDSATDVSENFALTPYNEWARRGPSTMRVWMRTR
jgi:uncharacterized protein